jgi:hypothetical protein
LEAYRIAPFSKCGQSFLSITLFVKAGNSINYLILPISLQNDGFGICLNIAFDFTYNARNKFFGKSVFFINHEWLNTMIPNDRRQTLFHPAVSAY